MNYMHRPDQNRPEPQQQTLKGSRKAEPVVVVSDDDEEELHAADYVDIFSKPPTVALTHLILGMVVQLFLKVGPGILGNVYWTSGGAVLIVASLLLARVAFKEFARHDTTVPTDEPATALVTSGIFARTRNPIYIALLMLYIGVSLALGNGWALILSVALFAYLNRHVIPREEAYLTRKFGADYVYYLETVPRWF